MMSLWLDSTLLNRPLDMQQYNSHRIQCSNLQKLLIVDQINSWGFSSCISYNPSKALKYFIYLKIN